MRLTEEEKAELQALASAPGLRSDLARLRKSHRDDFMVDGVVDSERVTEALTAYSEFVGGGSRPRRIFVERVMKL
ncbi:hypothetical protein DSOUD_2368 [Desulfuromonas soudanensis]|uniref:Uncharacterized protein n=1 Tax=Desulfuromonas soudanensis TaxID=1603606 RepID=A0A0M3QG00_9BACT|nr:hypothetical protein [Desulfuromonas soudanensis]ALC17129.1 hypothetical protein DSOUD_2368 [Desulfuromonas soudanensis]